ncbi:ATP-grasp domain-containing protein [Aporhodopirellula aestuarii]|uniref:ATP-grasp domain-containing protein n=1 Tax=Aporhodopirellula aestuarii TaxID=2950107 RepID=A0ABT0U7J9_9BACT|nr:hypothetical protein [Aporhodopirellula aestuarii]MCM2372892.1 hypothetical protein [Aporhodopirellula aestuarii]
MNPSTPVDSPHFVDTHGQMPPMWPRRAIFFANLLGLFFGNEAQTRELSKEVGELDSYSARLIPILDLLFEGPDNVLVVERQPDQALCDYLSNDLRLSLPRICVLLHEEYVRLGRLLAESPESPLSDLLDADHPLASIEVDATETWADGYVTDAVLPQIAGRLGCRTISSTRASQDGNNKGLLHRFLVSQGLPTVATEFADGPDDVRACAERLRDQGFASAVVRSQIGASGVGMMKLADLGALDSLPAVPAYFFHEGPCLVQGWLSPGMMGITNILSPSTQLFLDEDHVYAFDMTEQILSEHNIHEGNESPPPYLDRLPNLRDETIRQAKVVGRWLHETGYRGTASIDWLVVEREGKSEPDVYVCEINARVTGATYPSLLAKYFRPSGAWLLRNLRLAQPVTSAVLLRTLEERGHLFHLKGRAGVLPLNFNFGRDGLVHKGQFICIGADSQECHRFLSQAEADLPGGWIADRD